MVMVFSGARERYVCIPIFIFSLFFTRFIVLVLVLVLVLLSLNYRESILSEDLSFLASSLLRLLLVIVKYAIRD